MKTPLAAAATAAGGALKGAPFLAQRRFSTHWDLGSLIAVAFLKFL